MKKDLIDKLFNELDKDKENIKNNLLIAMDNIILQCENDYEKITLTIKIEKKEKNKNGL